MGQQHRRLTHRIMLLLGAGIALFTLPYVAYHASLLRLCSPACTLRRLLAALGSEDPRLRRADCRNQTDQLLRVFGLRDGQQLDLTRPTYVWLDSPADVSGSCVDAASIVQTTQATGSQDGCFNQTYSVDDKLQVYHVLHRLQQNFTQWGVQIFISDGSLLGSARHFGIIPWDDDIDFQILRDQKFEARELLIELSHLDEFQFVDGESVTNHWRFDLFCQVDKTKPPEPQYGLSRLFPSKVCKISMDLFFGDVVGDHFLRYEAPYVFSTKDIYPLRLLPFGPYLMWGPANPRAVTAAQYGHDYEFSCMFEIHSQRFQCGEKFLECDRLRRVYPFVNHAQLRVGERNVSADILVWRSQVMALFIPPQ